mmetsp:Transcript_11665/g.23549  ORF Transcript_11665/g.23549 Transcript_11665/m.23549 type:complete len:226 (-) Transcript_11665:461-1138(-)
MEATRRAMRRISWPPKSRSETATNSTASMSLPSEDDEKVEVDSGMGEEEEDDEDEEEDDEESSSGEDDDSVDEDSEDSTSSSEEEEEEDDDDDDSSSSSSEDYDSDDELVRTKIIYEDTGDIRVRNIATDASHTELRRRLRKEYKIGHDNWTLCYYDDEGDKISIKGKRDLRLALRDAYRRQGDYEDEDEDEGSTSAESTSLKNSGLTRGLALPSLPSMTPSISS